MNDSNKNYIRNLYAKFEKETFIKEMELYAAEHRVPIIETDGVELLKQLVRLHRPKHILEIGTAIGYSTIQMALANKQTHITSVELDETRYLEANQNVNKANLSDRIQLILDDANEYLNNIKENEFDFVFIDAAKGQYINYVKKISPFLRSGSLLVIDNVLFKGYVSKEVQDDRKRLVKLGEKIDRFNHWLIEHPEYDTTIMETGDGVAIALKR
ncbi:O-methyltransferase [Piscibacillus sp. B03]|uniref:O-methyltransferase n=1 Tax=Piscibacillus sp. B03 TaxID=3457430 RepID=UPI003FCDD6B1